MRTISIITCRLATCLLHGSVASAQSTPADAPTASTPMVVAHNGQPTCTIVVAGPTDTWLLQHGVEAIRTTIDRWSGAGVPLEQASTLAPNLPVKPAIIVATLEGLHRDLPKLAASVPLIERVAFLDEQGFICTTQKIADVPCVLVVGRTPRAAYNGAVWLRDFCIDGPRDHLVIYCDDIVRTPQLAGRAVYLLTIWAHEAEYTAADWEQVFDSFVRDGFDRVYFWVSGHFPSKAFPQTFKCRDAQFDTTQKSRIATIDDLQRIIRAAHDRGLKIYAGGALGAWCCTCLLTNLAPGTVKTPPKGASYPDPSSLCPSHPASRRALIDYYKEIYDALPEADGLFIESADEWGGCFCPTCSKTIDDLGSTQFGRSQITLIQDIMHTVWRDHPHARLSYTIGYAEHRKDPAYYEMISQMSDPRIEWMEARNSWMFPGLGGRDLPAATFSRQVMRWQQYYAHPLEQLVNDAGRVAQSGMYGLITAFEPGAGTGSFHKQIPYPTGVLPYVLTGFVWREATWSPTLTTQAMCGRVWQRFFGREASPGLGQDLWDLRELTREAASSRKKMPELQEKLSLIEQHVQQARSTASPKTAESLDLMTQAIADIRPHVK